VDEKSRTTVFEEDVIVAHLLETDAVLLCIIIAFRLFIIGVCVCICRGCVLKNESDAVTKNFFAEEKKRKKREKKRERKEREKRERNKRRERSFLSATLKKREAEI